jgi:nucleotide-binding universal stress UspA family protein
MKLARILCPLDFSEASRHAVDQAVVVARYYRARITALHVIPPVPLEGPGEVTSAADGRELQRLRRQAAAEFAQVDPGYDVDALVDVGEASRVILECAAALPADLVVMGTHGRSGFQHLLLGSVAEKVLRKAPCPVLTVPPRAHATSQLPFTRVLCAVDFSDASMEAVRWAVSLAEESGASLTLLHVLEWPWEEPPAPRFEELPVEQGVALSEFRHYSEDSARMRLESLVPGSIPVSQITTKCKNGKSHVQILAAAAEDRADLIVVGVHGRNPVDLALFGSTTNQIVRRATCAVLTLRRKPS